MCNKKNNNPKMGRKAKNSPQRGGEGGRIGTLINPYLISEECQLGVLPTTHVVVKNVVGRHVGPEGNNTGESLIGLYMERELMEGNSLSKIQNMRRYV